MNFRPVFIEIQYKFPIIFSHHNHGDNTVDDVNYKCTGLNFQQQRDIVIKHVMYESKY